MGNQVSFMRQLPPQSAKSAIPPQPPVPAETFQMIDPARVEQSSFKPIHRDTHIMKLAASCDPDSTGETDTTFQFLLRETDNPSFGGITTVTDLLAGAGVLPAHEDYVEWYLYPQPEVWRKRSRLAINVTAAGAGVKGLIFEYLFTQQGLT